MTACHAVSAWHAAPCLSGASGWRAPIRVCSVTPSVLRRSSSPAPQQPTAKRVVSNGGLVRGTIGQAEDMGNLLGAASADVVANAKAAALQVSCKRLQALLPGMHFGVPLLMTSIDSYIGPIGECWRGQRHQRGRSGHHRWHGNVRQQLSVRRRPPARRAGVSLRSRCEDQGQQGQRRCCERQFGRHRRRSGCRPGRRLQQGRQCEQRAAECSAGEAVWWHSPAAGWQWGYSSRQRVCCRGTSCRECHEGQLLMCIAVCGCTPQVC